MDRLDILGRISELPGQLTRRYLSPAHTASMRQVENWMAEAGLATRIDPLRSLFGRYEGAKPRRPAIMIGSHLDTVVDAGRYDGGLGVLAAIAVVAELARSGERLEHAVEVAAFGEEEGSRFPIHILTSSALIGAVKPGLLEAKDASGVSVREALIAAGGDAKGLRACARKRGEIAAYLELHIEQGPVLEGKGLPLGAVTAINGSVRSIATVTGFAGHAGTVPMGARRDSLTAASEMIGEIEKLAVSQDDLVATVGRMKVLPGVQNVIPGRVEFTIDLRSPSDAVRRRAHTTLQATLRKVGGRRGVDVGIDTFQENPAVALDGSVIDDVAEAIAACGEKPLRLPSGAGHDAGIMAKLCPSGMIFLRCKDGISHNPAESITVEDADLGVRTMLEAVRRLDRRLSV